MREVQTKRGSQVATENTYVERQKPRGSQEQMTRLDSAYTRDQKEEMGISDKQHREIPRILPEKKNRLMAYIATWKSKLMENDLTQLQIRETDAIAVRKAGGSGGNATGVHTGAGTTSNSRI